MNVCIFIVYFDHYYNMLKTLIDNARILYEPDLIVKKKRCLTLTLSPMENLKNTTEDPEALKKR